MPVDERVLYGSELSGHSHRARLLLDMLGLPYRFESTSTEERRSPAFLALNPLGQIPVSSFESAQLTIPIWVMRLQRSCRSASHPST